MSMSKAIRQIQELMPNRGYAIVFNQRLRAEDLKQLKEVCEKGQVKVLILTDARVVPLDQVFAVVGKTDEAQIAKALEPEPLDVTEAQPNG
jgi:hypothetical protein